MESQKVLPAEKATRKRNLESKVGCHKAKKRRRSVSWRGPEMKVIRHKSKIPPRHKSNNKRATVPHGRCRQDTKGHSGAKAQYSSPWGGLGRQASKGTNIKIGEEKIVRIPDPRTSRAERGVRVISCYT